MRTYKLFIQEYNIMVNDYITREEIVKTNDIYHEIGKIYCQSLVKIKRIDYLEITKDLEQEIERLNNIINELKVCNSDYYNQICTLSSKLSIINNYINDNKNCVPKHINDFINEILFDRHIKLGDENETKEN